MKPKTITASFTVNVHEGNEEKTVNQLQQVLTRATPDEVETLAKLFANDTKRKLAMSMAKNYL